MVEAKKGQDPEPRVVDFLEEFKAALEKQLLEDEKHWGTTWLKRPMAGQEGRTRNEFNDYFDKFENGGEPIPWLKVAGNALICWIREQHPELRAENRIKTTR